MISMGRFILQNESLKMVYFLIVSYGLEGQHFLLRGKSEISGKLSARRSISIVFIMKN